MQYATFAAKYPATATLLQAAVAVSLYECVRDHREPDYDMSKLAVIPELPHADEEALADIEASAMSLNNHEAAMVIGNPRSDHTMTPISAWIAAWFDWADDLYPEFGI